MSQKYSAKPSQSSRDLARELHRIDHKGYGAYKDLLGSWNLGSLTLFVDRVQPDPYAPPSRIRLRISLKETGIPKELYNTSVRRIALEDLLARNFREVLSKRHGGNEKITLAAGGQEMLERTALRIASEAVEVRMNAEFPARGRTVLGRRGEELLVDLLPQVARESLSWSSLTQEKAWNWIKWAENRSALEEALKERGYVAFVANGSILPRKSGASQEPLSLKEAVPFASPSSLEVEIPLPHTPGGAYGEEPRIRGMALPEGITLIVGGGFHGKSTLLYALARGVYPHIPGDGREYVVTRSDGMVIRAEDGRPIGGTDISPFITNLPRQKDTVRFFTPNASGSTSQAANIMEALEAGSRLLLLDEDSSATNFMIRDQAMERLITSEDEPITPFRHRVKELHRRHRISTLLVMGGCGDYFGLADRVIMMKNYLPLDVTSQAREIALEGAAKEGTLPKIEVPSFRLPEPAKLRIPSQEPHRKDSRGGRGSKIKSRGTDEISLNGEVMDLRRVEQLVDSGQTRAIGGLLKKSFASLEGKTVTVPELLDRLEELLENQGLDRLGRDAEKPQGDLVRPRRLEIIAALNRLHSTKRL